MTGTLRENLETLSAALSQWENRDDSRPQPEIRRAASTAMDAIDAMLAVLHALRSRLVSEIRESDDATAARADALLAKTRAAAPKTPTRRTGCAIPAAAFSRLVN